MLTALNESLGAGGKFASAESLFFTSTPLFASAQGLCAGARLVILARNPGAELYPVVESYKVSACALIGICLTLSGTNELAPLFILIFGPPVSYIVPPLVMPMSSPALTLYFTSHNTLALP